MKNDLEVIAGKFTFIIVIFPGYSNLCNAFLRPH